MAGGSLVRCLVVGVDGSKDAAEALAFAIRLASSLEAEIVAVFASESTLHLSHAGLYGKRMTPPGSGRSRVSQVDDFVERWCQPLAESGVPYRTIVEPGDPSLVIAGVAERLDADLVVVGRRGLGPIAGLVLGSVSERLSHACRRPVVLVSHRRASVVPPPVSVRRSAAAGSDRVTLKRTRAGTTS